MHRNSMIIHFVILVFSLMNDIDTCLANVNAIFNIKLNNKQKGKNHTWFSIHLCPFRFKLFIPRFIAVDVIISTNLERHYRPLYKQSHCFSPAICKLNFVANTSKILGNYFCFRHLFLI